MLQPRGLSVLRSSSFAASPLAESTHASEQTPLAPGSLPIDGAQIKVETQTPAMPKVVAGAGAVGVQAAGQHEAELLPSPFEAKMEAALA